MSTDATNTYIKGLEYDLDLEPEEIEAEVYANITEDRDPNWLLDWAEALESRGEKMRELCEIYERAAEQARDLAE